MQLIAGEPIEAGDMVGIDPETGRVRVIEPRRYELRIPNSLVDASVYRKTITAVALEDIPGLR